MPRTHAHQPGHQGAISLALRPPTSLDGNRVHALIERCPPLDRNSLYCNLLQCSMFADTCTLAESEHGIAGFVSGFLQPAAPHTLFIWQVAVAPEMRGHGLGIRMLLELLARPACRNVHELQTTITPDNQASWSLFGSLARRLNTPIVEQPLFERTKHFNNLHDTEMLIVLRNVSPTAVTSSRLTADLMTLT